MDLDPMINQNLIGAQITIEEDVWISTNCTITKGVTIATGSIRGANSVVTKNMEPFTIAGDIPA